MIREMTINDFNSIYKLGQEISENYQRLNTLSSIINDRNQKIYVYIINSTVAGFIHLTVSFDEADIIDIITEKEYRCQKIGTSLINFAITNNNLKKINLEVRESNKVAIAFYQKLHFKTIRKIKKYYGNEDAIFMIREIIEWKMYIY